MKTNSTLEQPAGQHRKLQFSLRHALIAIAIFAVGISFWTAWRQSNENAGLKSTIRRLKDQLGEIDVESREHLLHVAPQWTNDLFGRSWKVYVPEGRHFFLHVATGAESPTSAAREVESLELPAGMNNIFSRLVNDKPSQWTCWIHSGTERKGLAFAGNVPEPIFRNHSSFILPSSVAINGKQTLTLWTVQAGNHQPETSDKVIIWISEKNDANRVVL